MTDNQTAAARGVDALPIAARVFTMADGRVTIVEVAHSPGVGNMVGHARRSLAVHTFVCSGCLKAIPVLFGRSIICGCGQLSSAEVVDGE